MVSPNLGTTSRENQGAYRRMRSGLIRAHDAVRCVDSLPVYLQLPFPSSYHVGMNIVFTRSLANCLAAFKRLQRNPELVGRRVSPPFLDHRAAPPQAG